MAFAPPVSRGNFHYNGNLYVEVGNLNRHERASIHQITAILRPDLKKSKKSSIESTKDPVGHWYEAQLLHYGLPPSKDKARAKMRLLEALNDSKLTIPPNIDTMEAEMKKEYAAAERKAKAQYKASMTPAQKSEVSTVGKKRKQSDGSGNVNNINVSINLGNDFHGFPGAINASQSPAKKAKTEPSKPINKKNKGTTPSKPSKKTTEPATKRPSSQAQNVPKRPRQTARNPKLTEAWLKDSTIGPGPINPETGLRIPRPSSMIARSSAQKPPAAKKPIVKKPSKVKQEPKVKAETPVKKEPTLHPPNFPPLGLINGLYDLSCPTVESEWSCTDLTLTLSLSGSSLWGAYDLDAFSGILFLPSRPWHSSDARLPFTWRGRETGEGQMSFRHGCEGEMAFVETVKLKAGLVCMGGVGFGA